MSPLIWTSLLVGGILIYLIRRFMTSKPSTQREKDFASQFSSVTQNISEMLAPYKVELFAGLAEQAAKRPSGLTIAEIGIGAGANLKYYPAGTKLISVEPNPHFEPYFEENRTQFKDTITDVKFITSGAEDMSRHIGENQVDAVVSTHVLCSTDTRKALHEVVKVLKPGGKLYYLEHVLPSIRRDPLLHLKCRMIQPWWSWEMCGCKFVDIHPLIAGQSGLQIDWEESRSVDGFSQRFIRPHIYGVATKMVS